MVEHDRRRVLTYSGLALVGGVLPSGVATADTDEASSSLEEASGWSSLGGGPGNNAVVPAGGPASPVTVAWEYDHGGPVAVVDDTVYLTGDGAVHALDAADGTLEWKTEPIGATGTPAVTADHVYVGGERLSRIDRTDGTICCQADLGYDEAIPSPAIANGLVFVVADGVLYAVDAQDNEERWHFEPEDPLYEQPVAVADGAVFAVSESQAFALELEDGTVRWSDDEPVGDDEYSHFTPPNFRQVSYPVATENVVAVGNVDSEPAAVWPSGYATLYDTETGEKGVSSDQGPYTPGPIADDRFYARDSHDLEGYGRDGGEREWETEVSTYHVSSAAVGDGTVYAGLTILGTAPAGEAPEPEVGVYAFDDETGEREWAVDTEGEPELALADGTLYASADTLVAVRSEDDDGGEEPEDDESGEDDDGDDTTGEGDERDDDAGNESDGSGDDDAGLNSNVESNDDESEGMPGFTAGAGIVGSAATLEWLRRRNDDEAE
ncbi:outer membrane protein assembly factor BamB family protein [Natronorubrum halophilum]|uniref:outer membrane protein assembly factor BamB family protein n=1 Tax=Natronorubrum halophilum TaxID=1702106 RepID=UPI000EF71FD1|nr:PQQ-binding-like beta-propeller repeat protein [Natronorubrum halophilum]